MTDFLKDPDAKLNYTINWASEDGTNDGSDSDTGWLQGDTIASSTWTVPSGLTNEAESNTTKAATIQLSGGTAGTSYTITNQITTSTSGEIDDRSMVIQVIEK